MGKQMIVDNFLISVMHGTYIQKYGKLFYMAENLITE
jgi:hypothetical protein